MYSTGWQQMAKCHLQPGFYKNSKNQYAIETATAITDLSYQLWLGSAFIIYY